MSFMDWNHDGNKDFTDDFIEFQIYEDVMDDDNNSYDDDDFDIDYGSNSYSSGHLNSGSDSNRISHGTDASAGCLTTILIIVAALGWLWFIGIIFEAL